MRRLLPVAPSWLSATPPPGSRDGYGAGFFTNRGESDFVADVNAAVNGPPR